jgi:hypothetical protein
MKECDLLLESGPRTNGGALLLRLLERERPKNGHPTDPDSDKFTFFLRRENSLSRKV